MFYIRAKYTKQYPNAQQWLLRGRTCDGFYYYRYWGNISYTSHFGPRTLYNIANGRRYSPANGTVVYFMPVCTFLHSTTRSH